MSVDVLVAGGGPAGLAAAIAAASRGLSVQVHERRKGPVDKACGEGLMPAGVRFLEAMGVLPHLERAAPFDGIRYAQEDGGEAVGRFPQGSWGLGIRRPTLQKALALRARELGVEILEGSRVQGFSQGQRNVMLHTDGGTAVARILLAADGLSSPLRRQAGLDGPVASGRRFGIRRHYRLPEGSVVAQVEVHFRRGVEAYLTPVARDEIGLAFLWDEARLGPMRFSELLGLFPQLAERFSGCEPRSEIRGAGPLHRRARRGIAERLVLVGDAAGYVDALTGEGLSLAFAAAADLGRMLPGILLREASVASLAAFERRASLRFASYAALAHGLLMLSRRPWLRRRVIRVLGRFPSLFDGALRVVT